MEISPVQYFPDIPSFEISAQKVNSAAPLTFHDDKCAYILSHIGSPYQSPDQNMKAVEIFPVQHFADVINEKPA